MDTPAAPLSVTVPAARLFYRGRALFEDLNLELAGGRWTCLFGRLGVG